jgi:hypothetical protein
MYMCMYMCMYMYMGMSIYMDMDMHVHMYLHMSCVDHCTTHIPVFAPSAPHASSTEPSSRGGNAASLACCHGLMSVTGSRLSNWPSTEMFAASQEATLRPVR